MIIDDSGMNVTIYKKQFNKYYTQLNGVTHLVTSENYPTYQFALLKNYYGVNDKTEVTKQVIKDLKTTIASLEQILEQEQKQNLSKEDNEEER